MRKGFSKYDVEYIQRQIMDAGIEERVIKSPKEDGRYHAVFIGKIDICNHFDHKMGMAVFYVEYDEDDGKWFTEKFSQLDNAIKRAIELYREKAWEK